MANVSLDLVKDLRERTSAGMMDCKAALESSGGDIEKAIDYLRKKGISQAAKRAGREAREGLVGSRIEGPRAVLAETNCETDFVARTEDFRKLLTLVIDEVLASGEKATGSQKVMDRVAELSGKIGEKIVVRRARLIVSENTLFTYIHANHKLGVLVEIAPSKEELKNDATFQELGKHIAMQVAAGNPLCVRRSEVPAPILEREKAIFREEIKGKPENIVEKILQGKLEKFFQANCLLEQPYIKEDKIRVQTLLDQTGKKLGASFEVKQFIRFQLGDKTDL